MHDAGLVSPERFMADQKQLPAEKAARCQRQECPVVSSAYQPYGEQAACQAAPGSRSDPAGILLI